MSLRNPDSNPFYKPIPPGSQAPARNAFAITPNDSTFINETRGIYIGGTGNLAVTMAGGMDITFSALPAGIFLPIQVIKVKSTGTTATNLIGLY